MGESRKDRIDMLYELKELEVDSVPINILSPVEGTPMESAEAIAPIEVLKTIAVYRIVLPAVEIRYGGGRDRLGESQLDGLRIGINGMITGNYLTTSGSNIDQDKELLKKERLTVF
jgi:biotin synthase